MIVSHSHRFIFLRTEKTASTSLTAALEHVLQEGDIVYRTFSGAWKKILPVSPGGLKRKLPIIFGLHPHATASQARQVLGKKIFDSYFKFSVERNPWDRQLSLYSHRISKEEKNKTLDDFDRDMKNIVWRNLRYTRLNNFAIYSIGERVVADKVIQYRSLATEIQDLMEQFGITQKLNLPHHRKSPSGDRKPYHHYYSAYTRDLIANWYKNELREFGYLFDDKPITEN